MCGKASELDFWVHACSLVCSFTHELECLGLEGLPQPEPIMGNTFGQDGTRRGRRKFFLGLSQPFPEISGFSKILFLPDGPGQGWQLRPSRLTPRVIVSFLPEPLT